MMTEKNNYKHYTYKRLFPLVIFVLLIVGGTWAISRVKQQASEDDIREKPRHFNENLLKLKLRRPFLHFPVQQQEDFTFLPSEKTKKQKDQDPAKVLILAERDMENGNFDIAEDRLRTALVFHGRNVKLHELLGKALYFQKKYQEAEYIFRQQIFLDPENPVSMNNLSAALARQKKFHEAIVTLRQLLKSDPSSASATFNLAGIYAVSGDKKNALLYLEKAYALLGHRILFLVQDRKFLSLRQEKRFIELMEKAAKEFQKCRNEITKPAEKGEKKDR